MSVTLEGAHITRDAAREAAQMVTDLPGASAVEVSITGSTTGLTRYANSEIIQNTVRTETRATIRVAVGDRAASATTNQLDAARMRRTAERALEAAHASLPDPDFPGLPDPSATGHPDAVGRWDPSTATASPAQRAEAVRSILDAAEADNAAGVYETSSHVFAIVSSTGTDCYDGYTRCATTCLVDLGESATGWGEAAGYSRSDVDAPNAARRALEKARLGRKRVDAEPGRYHVVLEPSAVATLLEYLSYSGFGAKQMIEGESFLSSRAGDMVAAGNVTVADDAFHPSSIGLGFDFEGVPKQRVAVIDSGRATGPVTDLRTGRKLDKPSTGHSSGSNEFGPYAAHIVLEGGDRSLEDLIGDVDEGFLVTRFHYVNILERPSTLLTGMTRDGTFKISGGEVVGAVDNFRFAQSALDALAAVEGIGRDVLTFVPDWGPYGSTVAPALHVGEFNFASKTSH